MRPASLRPGLAAAIAAALLGGAPSGAADPPGKALYDYHCEQCHGLKGDGHGVAAPFLFPRPRDFTAGKFKIRTTPSGALPTDGDLSGIIRAGMPYTAMPAWPQLKDNEIRDLVGYVKSFSPEFARTDRQDKPLDIPQAPSISAESVERGKQIYADTGCARCHGDAGRGNGISALTLKDDWGHPIRPADLTKRWTFRGGPSRRDIFRAMSTGLNGTPMPAFAESLSVEQRWDLINYIHSLGPGDGPDYATLAVARKVAKTFDLAQSDAIFEGATTFYFPVVGQIVQPVREFHPGCNGIAVRAAYNESDLVLELRWHDMHADQSGKNAPDLAVPKEEDNPTDAAPAAEKKEEGGDFWGEAAAEPKKAAASDEGGFWDEGGGEAAPAAAKSEFSDAVAVEFPRERPTTVRKPYFIFGDKGNPVDIWFVDLAKPQPVLYAGQGSDSLERLGPRGLSGVARYDDGEWVVVLKRKLRSAGEISFEEGTFTPIAFSVWDGSNRERGSRRGLTTWWTLYLAPERQESPVGEMTKWAGAVLVLEVAFIGWARRRRRGEKQ